MKQSVFIEHAKEMLESDSRLGALFLSGSFGRGSADDYSDLDEQLDYYASHTEECLEIVRNANAWCDQFRDAELEKALNLAVLDRYLRLGNHPRQTDVDTRGGVDTNTGAGSRVLERL